MLQRLFHLYQRKRIININVNIIAAGLIAIGLSKIVVMIFEAYLSHERALVFTGIAVGSDIVFDVLIYYGLHWVANHWKPPTRLLPARVRAAGGADVRRARPFFRDASLVQFERMLLSPLYYIIGASLMYALQTWAGFRPSWALAIAFPTGLLVTRVLHTWYGIRTGRFRDDAPAAPETPVPEGAASGAAQGEPERAHAAATR